MDFVLSMIGVFMLYIAIMESMGWYASYLEKKQVKESRKDF